MAVAHLFCLEISLSDQGLVIFVDHAIHVGPFLMALNSQVSCLQKSGQRNRGAPHGQNRPRPSDHHPQFRSLNGRAQRLDGRPDRSELFRHSALNDKNSVLSRSKASRSDLTSPFDLGHVGLQVLHIRFQLPDSTLISHGSLLGGTRIHRRLPLMKRTAVMQSNRRSIDAGVGSPTGGISVHFRQFYTRGR